MADASLRESFAKIAAATVQTEEAVAQQFAGMAEAGWRLRLKCAAVGHDWRPWIVMGDPTDRRDVCICCGGRREGADADHKITAADLQPTVPLYALGVSASEAVEALDQALSLIETELRRRSGTPLRGGRDG